MNPEKKQKIEKNLKIIAKREGITPEEVKSEIGRAVSYALKSSHRLSCRETVKRDIVMWQDTIYSNSYPAPSEAAPPYAERTLFLFRYTDSS